MYDANIDGFESYDCTLMYDVIIDFGADTTTSEDCKLEIVTYALKDKRDSINFIPRDK